MKIERKEAERMWERDREQVGRKEEVENPSQRKWEYFLHYAFKYRLNT